MKKIIVILILFYANNILAQQDPLFSQYYSNDLMINPAVSGSKSYNEFNIFTRQQWLGFEGAPLTTSISYHGALNNRSALGGSLIYENLYPSMSGLLQLNYAYHVPLDYGNINLSFGIGAKLRYYSLDFNSKDLPPVQDNALSGDVYNKFLGDAASGVYLYGRDFRIGFSSTNLLKTSFKDPVAGSPYDNKQVRNYFGLASYKFNIINKDWHLEPSILMRKTESFSSVYDLSSRIIYLNNSWTGISYRTDQTVVVAFGFGSDSFQVSYSYDHTLSGEIQKHSFGTHEIGISFYIKTLATQRHISFWD